LHCETEAADARLVLRQKVAHELGGGFFDQLELDLYAAAAVEHHHDRDRLDVVYERRHGLAPAVVVDLEVLAAQIGDEAAVAIQNRGIDRHRVRGGSKLGLLPGTDVYADDTHRRHDGESDGKHEAGPGHPHGALRRRGMDIVASSKFKV